MQQHCCSASECSAPCSSSRNSSRPCRATRPLARVCESCPGLVCRCCSPPSSEYSPSASAASRWSLRVSSSSGGYLSAQDYVNGLRPAMYVGALVVAIGVVTALLVPSRRALSAPALASLQRIREIPLSGTPVSYTHL